MKIMKNITNALIFVICVVCAGCGETDSQSTHDGSEFVRITEWDGVKYFDYEDFESTEIDLKADHYLIGIRCDPELIDELEDPNRESGGTLIISFPDKMVKDAAIELNAVLNYNNQNESGRYSETLTLHNKTGQTVYLEPTFIRKNIEAVCVNSEGYESAIRVLATNIANTFMVTIPIENLSANSPDTVYLHIVTKQQQ